MKVRISLVFILTAIFCVSLVAQSVVVTRKKVTYTREKPLSDYKKNYTINYPKVRAASPAIKKKIEKAISYERVFLYFKLSDELKQSEWLDSADYEVIYNKHGILCISLSIEGSGAYADGDTKYAMVNLKTGTTVKPADIFLNLHGLLKIVNKVKDKEVSRSLVEARKGAEDIEGIEMSFRESAKYAPLKLDQFSISDQGITFRHDYQFAHVIQALQPPGELVFNWKDLKPYIKRDGLLAQFVR